MNIEDRLLSLRISGNKNFSKKISGIFSDSRKVIQGGVFTALKGKTQDGHNYLSSAVKNGAQVVVVDNIKKAKVIENLPVMVCSASDTHSVLPVLLNEFYNYPAEKMFCVGVTGTNGKTTVASLVAFLFSQLGWRTGLIGTIKNQFEEEEEKSILTTPDPAELYRLLNHFYLKGAQAVVMEVSSIGLDQKRVQGVHFNLGVFTNLSEDHLDYHSNMEKYFSAKKELFKPIPSSSLKKNHFSAILNFDSSYGVKLAHEVSCPYISYGEKNARFSWKILSMDLFGTRFKLHFNDQQFNDQHLEVSSPLLGSYNVSNTVAALCCVHSAGFSLEKAIKMIEKFPGMPGRMQRVSSSPFPLVFVDYAHTPQALESVLVFLHSCRKTPFNNKKDYSKKNSLSRIITVFGCGGERDKKKRPLMTQVVEKFSDLAFLTSDNPRGENQKDIIKDCLKGAKDKSKFTIEVDRKQAIHQALEQAKKQDIVLIAGKGHEQEQITQGSKRSFFSDVEIVKKYFNLP